MLIAHVHFTVAEADVDRALSALLAEAPAVRAMAGCATFLPFRDPAVAGGLGVMHEWKTEADFAAYSASEGFAAVGQLLRPMMIKAPISKRFDARALEVVN